MTATMEAFRDVGRAVGPADAGGAAIRLRLRARLHRRRIDRELVAGLDPNADPLRRERARELLDRSYRRRLAATLEAMQGEAESPAHPFTARVPLARGAIRESRAELDTVVGLLKAEGDVPARGVAMVEGLLTDGAGPLYGRDRDRSPALREALEAAIDCLVHGPFLLV